MRRLTAAGRLALVSTGLLLVGLVWGTVAVVRGLLGDWDFADDALVPVDSEPHVVSVATDRPTYVWISETTARRCTVTEDDGTALTLAEADLPHYLPSGLLGPGWIATDSFTASSSPVTVTCFNRTPSDLRVAIAADPGTPALALVRRQVVPLLLVGVGLVGLVASAVLRLRARRDGPSTA
ncbi:hypothetical protein [Nocardioides bruguierae]|uniref:Uncharacterized protein n=1 Tax=Nocardioides bruguierae TaxID=2945102 RepID=A0A9X2IE82_9ACTN|nr:hypothetical protein [Nocardioides bruguierae]MCM0620017.1 hypothetical protein [Nocardioides bruguierae]